MLADVSTPFRSSDEKQFDVTSGESDTMAKLDGPTGAPIEIGKPQAAAEVYGKAMTRLSAIANADIGIGTDDKTSSLVLPAMNQRSDSVEGPNKVIAAAFDRSGAASDKDSSRQLGALNGVVQADRPQATAQTGVELPSIANSAIGIAFRGAEEISEDGRADLASPAKESNEALKAVGAGQAVQDAQIGAGSSTAIVSAGKDSSTNSATGATSKAAANGETATEQLLGMNSQSTSIPSIAAKVGNQSTFGGGQPRGDSSGEGGNSSGSDNVSRSAAATKNVLTATDLTQVETGKMAAASTVHEGDARLPAANSSATQMAVQPMSEAGIARTLQNAMRGDLRVGVQTEAFGRVTIQTIATNGQLSAQLSLEDGKQSAALAVHLPAVEQKLTQTYGLNASVSLTGGSGGAAGGMMSDGGRGSNQNGSYQQNGGISTCVGDERFNPFQSAASNFSVAGSVSPRYGDSSLSARLDITV
jgi:hypothetical protein